MKAIKVCLLLQNSYTTSVFGTSKKVGIGHLWFLMSSWKTPRNAFKGRDDCGLWAVGSSVLVDEIFTLRSGNKGQNKTYALLLQPQAYHRAWSEESKALSTCSKSSMATRMAKSRCMNLSHGFSRKIPSARLVMMWLMATVPGQCMQLLFCIVSRIWHNLAVCMSLLLASSLTRGNLSFCSQFDHRCYAFAGVGWWGREGC